MDLDFSPTSRRCCARWCAGVCARHCGLDVVRELEDDPVGYPDELWKQLGELDLIGLMLPEEYGGSGMSMLDGAVVYEELGRALAPSPHFVSSVMSAGVLAAAGSDEQQRRVAAADRRGRRDRHPGVARAAGRLRCAGRPARGHCRRRRLAARRRQVARAVRAPRPTRLLVLARTGRRRRRSFLVDPEAPGVTLTQHHVDRLRHAVPGRLRGRAGRCGLVVGTAGDAWATWDAVMHDGIILLAAQAVGGAQYTLDDHHAVRRRTGTSSTSRSARSRRSRTTSPTRSPRSTAPRRSCTKRRGRATEGHAIARARADGQAVRVPDVPRRHRHGAAGVRRRRLHRSSTTSSSTSAGPSSCRSRGGTTATSRSSSPTRCSMTARSQPQEVDRVHRHAQHGSSRDG